MHVSEKRKGGGFCKNSTHPRDDKMNVGEYFFLAFFFKKFIVTSLKANTKSEYTVCIDLHLALLLHVLRIFFHIIKYPLKL